MKEKFPCGVIDEIVIVRQEVRLRYDNLKGRAYMMRKIKQGIITTYGGGGPEGEYDMRLGKVHPPGGVACPLNAIAFAMTLPSSENQQFLECWQYGSFNEWPEYKKFCRGRKS